MMQSSKPSMLDELPINQKVELDGIAVQLEVMPSGAILSAELNDHFKLVSVTHYLQLGFSSALEFDAGLAFDSERQRLVLSQWLPGVSNWFGAADALESLLNQVDVCRSAQKERLRSAMKEPARQRAEQRLRAQLSH